MAKNNKLVGTDYPKLWRPIIQSFNVDVAIYEDAVEDLDDTIG